MFRLLNSTGALVQEFHTFRSAEKAAEGLGGRKDKRLAKALAKYPEENHHKMLTQLAQTSGITYRIPGSRQYYRVTYRR